MEYVGKTVKKQFQGYGVFSGTVKSYDPFSGFFEVVYEDGDSEELELSDVALLLEEGKVVEATTQTELIETKSRSGRKPKKRRRVQLTGEIRGDSGNVDNLSKYGVDHEGFTITQEKKLRDDPNDGLEPKPGLSSITGLDLNDGLSFNNTSISDVNFEGSVKMRDRIDLNLNANAEFDENPNGVDSNVEIRKRECSFDLNLGFDDESNGTEGVHGGQLVEKTGFQRVEETPKAHEEGGRANGSLKGIFFENVKGNSGEEIRGTASFGCVSACYVQDSRSLDFQMEGGFSDAGTPINNEYTPVNNEDRDSLGSSYRRRTSGTKRRKHSENLKVDKEPALRRSRRKGSPTPTAQNHVLISSTPRAVIDMMPSPVISAVFDGKPDISVCEGTEELSGPPLNLPLPPSSQNLNLDGIPVLDLFSIYACLRSFSTLLFLSPFELEDFVAALKCQSSGSLFDSIHVSILQTLRKHLEHLSNEGSQSATDCLRCLNWGLLDLVTWPIFMVEYLLFQGSGLKPDFDLSRMKLFDSDYYRQPVSVKVEILRCLCDDVIEVEAIRSEINRRALAALPDKDFERSANIEMCKKRRTVMDVSGGSCLTEEVLDETTDGNSDECCLCKMDGSLICCDGCPAAYHSRCVGVSNDLLPEGDWYCPECTIDKHKPRIKPQKSVRGAELLGHDPQGRLYFSSCGYLLVSDACDSEYTFSYYHRDDLNVVIDMLKSSDIHYSGILNLISKHWDIPTYFRRANNNLVSQYPDVCSNLLMKGHIPVISTPSQPLEPSETCAVEDETVDQRRAEENSNVVENSSHHGHMVAKSVDLLDSVTTNHFIKMENPLTSSDGSAEIVQASTCIDKCKYDSESLNKPTGLLNLSEIPRKLAPVGDPLICSTTEIKQDENLECAFAGYHVSAIKISKGNFSEVDCGPVYVNYYSFGQTAASVGEELMP